MQINCPHCGLREESEFVFGRALEGVSDPRNVEPFTVPAVEPAGSV